MGRRVSALAVLCAAVLLGSCSGHARGGMIPATRSRGLTANAVSYSSTILADGPTAYYRLDDTASTAADSGGNNLSGTIGSSVTKSVSGLLTGDSDTAMAFPGVQNSSGAVTVPRTALLEPSTTVSMEMWLRFTTTPKTYTVPMAYGDDTVYAPYDFYFNSGKIVAQFFLSSGALIATSPSALSANTTYYLAATYDGTTARLFVNGAQVASASKTGTLSGYKANFGLAIGDDAGFSDPGFAGTLDEVAVYSGKVLSAAQVQNHYNAGVPPTPTPSPSPSPSPTPVPTPTATPHGTDAYSTVVLGDSPAAYYRLDDTTSTALDSSGNGFNGHVGSGVTENAGSLLAAITDAAMSFPGTASSSGVVSVPQNTALQPSTAVSFESWIRFAATPATYTVLFSYGTDQVFAPYDLYFQSGKIIAQFYLTSGVLIVASPSALQTNTTYYVAATFDGATARLYLNGSQVASASKTGTLTAYNSGFGLAIGDDAGFTDPGFKGTIDDLAVYAGKALTATQIQNHYHSGTGMTPTPTPSPTTTPIPVDWSTMGYDLARSGYNSNETTIGTGSFGTMHSMWTSLPNVGYFAIGEPAVAMNVNVNGTSRNLLYEGGWNAIMYAIDADTGAVVWSQQLGKGGYSCNGGGTTGFGIEGTPTIDRARNRIYVPDGMLQVHALDLSTGSEALGWPINIAPGTDVTHNFIYGGLTYNPSNGTLYAESATTCDIVPWLGRIVAINVASATLGISFFPSPTGGGGIWGWGGASIDPATNNVFIATGNSSGKVQNLAYAEQIVELSADLSTVIDHHQPSIPFVSDADFGATPLLFQPPGCPPLLAAVNKSGAFVLYNRTNLSAGPLQDIDMSLANDTGDFIGVPTYDPVTNYVYIGLPTTFGAGSTTYHPGAGAFSVQSNCTINPVPVWSVQFGPDGALTTDDVPRSTITVANGVVYVSGDTDKTTYAFNAATGARIWSAALSDNGIPGPVVVDGRLYVVDVGGTIHAWKP